MSKIDFHCHVFPNHYRRFMPDSIRNIAKRWTKPLAPSLHHLQTSMRWIPEKARLPLDEMGVLMPLAGLIFESSWDDLRESVDELGLDYALLIAHPPQISNEFILDLCAQDSRFFAAASILPSTGDPSSQLRQYADRGVRVVKIHPASYGLSPDSDHYRIILETASDLGLPVILHTGCLNSHLLYKKPQFGDVRIFEPWFKKYRSIIFVLAHMNFHEPTAALDLGEKYENVFVDTSWQPFEVIAEAVRRIGSSRVLLASDWPFIGHNQKVSIDRVEECVRSNFITRQEADDVLGKNAAKLLRI